MATQLHSVTVARYGWRRDLPDPRDYAFQSSPTSLQTPSSIDLRSSCPPIMDQSESGACTAFSLMTLMQFDTPKGGVVRDRSSMHLYWLQREVEGTAPHDVGAQFRSGLKALQHEGVSSEGLWPVSSGASTSHKTQTEHTILVPTFSYFRLPQTLLAFRQCLAAGSPFVFGMSVFSNMESDLVSHTGDIPLPRSYDMLLGGHAVTAVGYDDAAQSVIIQNSWGTGWGDKGFGYLPYSYILDTQLASDFWTIRYHNES